MKHKFYKEFKKLTRFNNLIFQKETRVSMFNRNRVDSKKHREQKLQSMQFNFGINTKLKLQVQIIKCQGQKGSKIETYIQFKYISIGR